MTYPPPEPVLSGDDLTYSLTGGSPGPVNTDAGNRPLCGGKAGDCGCVCTKTPGHGDSFHQDHSTGHQWEAS